MSLFRKKLQGSVELECDPGLVYDILSDYDNYFEWIAGLGHSKLLAREGDLALAEFEEFDSHHRFAVECIQTRNQGVLLRRISGDVPVLKLDWQIAPGAAGQSRVSLEVELDSGLMGLFSFRHRMWNCPELLTALTSRVSMFSSTFQVTDESGQKILEMIETEDGLIVWYMGKKFVLQPGPGDTP